MIIGIDARMMGKGFGLGRYVEQLTSHISVGDHENEYVLFVKPDFQHQSQNSHIKSIIADVPWYTLDEQINLPGIIKKAGVDLMHFPHWNVPFLYRGPFIVTVHDLTMYHYPRPEATTLGPVRFWLKDKAHRFLVRHAVKKAEHIIVTSQFTKQDVHETLGVPFEKMTVIYQAPFRGNNNFQVTHDNHPSNLPSQISKPYILYVGAAYPHKNVARLIEAWKIFEEKYKDTYQLVLVGKENYFWKRMLNTAGLNQGTPNDQRSQSIVFFGFASDEELEVIYKNASLFVFPSLYEGFGLPPLEAMVRGIPVVSSGASCLPEILGEAAMYFDPEDSGDMARAIEEALMNEDIRTELKLNARQELARYSAERMALQTRQVYRAHGLKK